MESQNVIFAPTATDAKKFLTRTYLWMGLALLVSAAVAFFGASSGLILSFLVKTSGMGIFILCIAELVLVFGLTSSIRKISVGTASIMFVVYSALNGLTFSTIFFVYELNSIAICFVSSSLLFFAMALYGARTKSDLTSAGRYLTMALMGILIASLVNGLLYLFGAGSSMLDWLISIVAVVVFTGLTAYDSQKIMAAARKADSSDAYKKIAVIGALELYLDFINIFLYLLKLFGKRK
ncbi:Bax inhibitor-1/YccA family protein [Treponema sp.]|uniref:Bax inhibitor-1/YccA family protein n=1 Tax=Treponema sp. TaxID=166 RepID=UPI003F02D100